MTIRYRRHPAAVWRATSGFLVAAVPSRPPTRVAGSAGAVWNALAEPRALSEVVAVVAAAMQSDLEVIVGDVEALLVELVRLELVEEVP